MSEPNCSPALQSAMFGRPFAAAAARNARLSELGLLRSDTPSGPPAPWCGVSPKAVLFSARLKYGSTSAQDQPRLPSAAQWS
jgi:hypothetical protein